ncbi:MAG: hypothetical protein IJM62_04970 [Lachnospiraceae bacterium]|nr:hypothetical protein [Bacillota bacterium]MBQ9828015.1 hypothetical protein [Lachnospiraceae bacterium]
MKLYENDILQVNDLIYKIYTIQDFDEMRRTFLNLLKIMIPCDPITFYMNEEGRYMCDPIVIGITEEDARWYTEVLAEIDYKKWIFQSGQNKVCRMTDFYPEGIRESLPYYQTAYVKYDIHYEAIMSLAHDHKFLGVVSLYRKSDEEDFSDRDIFILNLLMDHLSYRLHMNDMWKSVPGQSKTVSVSGDYIDTFCFRHDLTKRESEILKLMSGNRQSNEICDELSISMSTLRKHTGSIYKKLNISNRVDLYKILNGEQ